MYFYKLERRGHYCYVFLGFLPESWSISIQICVFHIQQPLSLICMVSTETAAQF